jgi:hypothetical protein
MCNRTRGDVSLLNCLTILLHAFSEYTGIINCTLFYDSRGSAVGIVTGYGLDDRGVGVLVPVFSISSRPALRPTQPMKWALEALPLGVQCQRRQAYTSPPTSAGVKKTWISTTTPPYIIMT